MKKNYLILLFSLVLIFSSNKSQAQCYSGVQLDGINQFMHTPFADYNFANFTMEMWINSSDFTSNEHYISLYQNSYIVLGGWDNSGSIDTWADGINPITINSGTTPSVNTWHHIAYVFDGTNQILYIDGTAVATVATSGTLTSSTSFSSGLVIGARYTQGTQYTNSAFDDVRIWNVARTPTEITNNMNISLTGNETGLLAYYRFEDGLGSSTVTDLTGNGHTLTFNNMDPATDWIVASSPVSIIQTIDVQSSCGPLTWIDGNVYTTNNNTATYTYLGGAANGCDSVVTLDLTINTPSASTDVLSNCDSVTWIDGNVYTTSNNTATHTYVGGAANGCDSVVTLNLTITQSQQSTDVQSTCGPLTWIDGNVYTTSNNTATHTYVGGAANGCDSVVTLDLTINTVDTTVTTQGLDITSSAVGVQYQWVDCDNGYSPINGETNQIFTASSNGNYAVIVTDVCSDTSECVAITTVSLNESDLLSGILVSPNPSNGKFSISSKEYSGEIRLEISDVTGKIVFKTTENLHPNKAINIDLSNVENSVYFVHIIGQNETFSIRIIKD